MSPGRFRWVSRSRALRMRAASPGEDKYVALHTGRCNMGNPAARRGDRPPVSITP
jgi:hypothetical protein